MTPATIQTLVVVLVIASALLYLGRRFWRTFSAARARRKGDAAACGAGCGCGEAGTTPTRLKARL